MRSTSFLNLYFSKSENYKFEGLTPILVFDNTVKTATNPTAKTSIRLDTFSNSGITVVPMISILESPLTIGMSSILYTHNQSFLPEMRLSHHHRQRPERIHQNYLIFLHQVTILESGGVTCQNSWCLFVQQVKYF